MRRLPLFMSLAIVASVLSATSTYAQGASAAFSAFETLCLETRGKSAGAAEAAKRAGWRPIQGVPSSPEAEDPLVFQNDHEGSMTLLVMTVPASALHSSASGAVCMVGEVGADERKMVKFLTEWTGFEPEDDGGFDFWAYATVDGVRTPERGLMSGLTGDELVSLVRDRNVSIIGVMPGPAGPSFYSIMPIN